MRRYPYDDESTRPIIGNCCEGGGASINNSPININFNIHIHTSDTKEDDKISTINKLIRALGIENDTRKNKTINISSQFSEEDIRRELVRKFTNG